MAKPAAKATKHVESNFLKSRNPKAKRTSIGKSRNSRPNDKRASREKKGR
jgi:hypothetical protein